MFRRAKSSLSFALLSLLVCDGCCCWWLVLSMVAVGPGQQDECRWRLALLRSTMYFTLLKLCHLCAPPCAGDRKHVSWHAHWSLIKLFCVAVLLHKSGLWSVPSSLSCATRYCKLTIPFSFQLLCAYSSYRKYVETLLPPLQPEANIVTGCDQCPLKTEKVHQEIAKLPGRLESLLNTALKTFWSLDWIWEVWKSPWSWSCKKNQIVSSSLNSLM